MQETWQEPQVRSLGWEDPLEKAMATHSSIFAWETLCTESQTVGYDWATKQQKYKLSLEKNT